MKILGVIGGSGMYEMDGLTNVSSHRVSTPFGDPSDEIISGQLGDVSLYFLSRHGRGHRYLPSEINYRANIHALKQMGVHHTISVSAVGSMKEEIVPGTLVLPNQFIDRTHKRVSTFYGEGIVGHVSFSDPVCQYLHETLYDTCKELNLVVHKGGTYMCMEGPQFSTRAESLSYRALGVSVIGMTNMPEAKLAREAGMSYATLALATDYDCWHESESPVTLEAVLKIMKKNVSNARDVVKAAARFIDYEKKPFEKNFRQSTVTDFSLIPDQTKSKLKLLLGL